MKFLIVLAFVSASFASVDVPVERLQYFGIGDKVKCVAGVFQNSLNEGISALRKNLTDDTKQKPNFALLSASANAFNEALMTIGTSVTLWTAGQKSTASFIGDIPSIMQNVVSVSSQVSNLKDMVQQVADMVDNISGSINQLRGAVTGIPAALKKC